MTVGRCWRMMTTSSAAVAAVRPPTFQLRRETGSVGGRGGPVACWGRCCGLWERCRRWYSFLPRRRRVWREGPCPAIGALPQPRAPAITGGPGSSASSAAAPEAAVGDSRILTPRSRKGCAVLSYSSGDSWPDSAGAKLFICGVGEMGRETARIGVEGPPSSRCRLRFSCESWRISISSMLDCL